MVSDHRFFATCPKGLEGLLADELRSLGAVAVKETRAGVAFSGPLALGYRACLWSRLASRVLLPLAQFPAASPEALYAGVQTLNWDDHLGVDNTLAVDFTTSGSAITHSQYGALKVKDAIVDQLRARHGARPSVDRERPDVRVNVYLHNDEATLNLDLSGESLHRRGYRAQGMAAPLKENLAAALLLRAQWPAIAERGGPLIDPMCGSGTLPIEAALMAADIAPGLLRPHFGFLYWRGHDADAWAPLMAEAQARREAGLGKLPPIRGFDHDRAAVHAALENVARAGLQKHVHIERRELAACVPETSAAPGLVIANPPYGERLGEQPELPALYAALGEAMKRCYAGFHAAVFTANPELGKHLGIRARRMHALYNGALEGKLLHFDLQPEWYMRERKLIETLASIDELDAGAQMFANRLRKNLKQLGKWAQREGVTCYRVYDADMPEYNLAVDLYQDTDGRRFAHVQEYEAPASIDERSAHRRLRGALAAAVLVLAIPAEHVFLKVRKRQKGHAQYEKLAETGEFHEIQEGACHLLVNFTDYLDTGLFLDHRMTRALVGRLAHGRHVLNLFGYTGTASVHAARGGALSTTTVDMSNTYLDWARRNFTLNDMGLRQHELIQADVLVWLRQNRQRRYGLIFLDPPTFSRSKRMEDTLDVQRDHVALINDAAALLEHDGVLIFSTNNRRFRLDTDALSALEIEDITRATLPEDFRRNPRIHQCFQIRRRT